MKQKKYLIYIAIFLILNFLLITYLYLDKNKTERIYVNQKINQIQLQLTGIISGYSHVITFVFDQIEEKTARDIYLMRKRQNLKRKIYLKLEKVYLSLKKIGFDEFYIKLPDGTIFLRMHNPQKISNKNKRNKINPNGKYKLISGIDGYKYIKHLFYKNRYVGSIEINLPYSAVQKDIQKVYGLLNTIIIHKDYIFNRKLKERIDSYIQSDISPEFYYNSSKQSKAIILINKYIKEKVKNKLTKIEKFAVPIEINDSWYLAVFIPIKDYFLNKKVGYLITYQKDNSIPVLNKIFLENLIFGEIIILFLIGILIYNDKAKERFEHLANTDALTNINNRAKFNEVSTLEFSRAKRYKRPLSTIIFDIDHFKNINDTYGHDVGDYVLKKIAQIVKENIRNNDFFARFGGEEFIILTPETDINGANKLANKLKSIIENYNFDKVDKITASFGVSEISEEDKSIDDVIKRADTALYRAKDRGRNRVEIE